MLKKVRVGRQARFFLKNFIIIIFSLERAYGTLMQNVVKFKYTQVIHKEVKPSPSH